MSHLSFDQVKSELLARAMPNVVFDGWTDATFQAAVADSGIDPVIARSVCPRGALDLAVAFHEQGDADMIERFAKVDKTDMRIREKVTLAAKLRLQVAQDKEAVRRGTTLFALPQNAAEGAKLIWGTADAIWTVLGDTSTDVNWYTKRATLSAVYGATVLFWLGDDSIDHADTWDFLDRRIENVMQFEKAKSQAKENPTLAKLFAGPIWLAGQIKRPPDMRKMKVPGQGFR